MQFCAAILLTAVSTCRLKSFLSGNSMTLLSEGFPFSACRKDFFDAPGHKEPVKITRKNRKKAAKDKYFQGVQP